MHYILHYKGGSSSKTQAAGGSAFTLLLLSNELLGATYELAVLPP